MRSSTVICFSSIAGTSVPRNSRTGNREPPEMRRRDCQTGLGSAYGWDGTCLMVLEFFLFLSQLLFEPVHELVDAGMHVEFMFL